MDYPNGLVAGGYRAARQCAAEMAIPSSNGPLMRAVLQSGSMITRGFHGRRSRSESKRLPPGQHETGDFPVLSAGPTPNTPLDVWTFALEAEDGTTIASWGWQEFRDLGPTE